MFQLTRKELKILTSQNAMLRSGQWGRHFKYLPYAFTEQGVAMLSGVLNSPRAIEVNVAIMRAFVRLRQVLASHKGFSKRLEEIEHLLVTHDSALGTHSEEIPQVFDILRQLMQPPLDPKRKIGYLR